MKPLRELSEFNFILTKLVGYKIDVFPVLGICTAVDSVASAARLSALEPQQGKCGEERTCEQQPSALRSLVEHVLSTRHLVRILATDQDRRGVRCRLEGCQVSLGNTASS